MTLPTTFRILKEIKVLDNAASVKPSLTLNEQNLMRKLDGREALEQSINRVLTTQRYRYTIYDHRYGLEYDDLIGQPYEYVRAELPRRIAEALLEDDRINEVNNFEISKEADNLYIQFNVNTVHGVLRKEAHFEF